MQSDPLIQKGLQYGNTVIINERKMLLEEKETCGLKDKDSDVSQARLRVGARTKDIC